MRLLLRYVHKQSNWCSNMAVCWLCMWTNPNTAVVANFRTADALLTNRAAWQEITKATHFWFLPHFILNARLVGLSRSLLCNQVYITLYICQPYVVSSLLLCILILIRQVTLTLGYTACHEHVNCLNTCLTVLPCKSYEIYCKNNVGY